MAFDIRKWNIDSSLTSLELIFIQDLAEAASYDADNIPLTSALSFETPTGDVDNSNVTFTVLNTPLYIIVNGSTYFENAGFTLSSLTLTLDGPVGSGGFIRSAYS